MNPYVLIGGAALIAIGSATAGWKVSNWRHDSQDLLIERAAAKGAEVATNVAASAIQSLGTQYIPIKGGIQRETRIEPVYINCEHTPAAWGLLDRAYQAAGGEPFPSGAGVPTSAPSTGPELRGDNPSPR